MSEMKVNCQEAATYLGVSVKTVRRWAQNGKLKGHKVGSRGDWRFSHEQLNNLFHYDDVRQLNNNILVDIKSFLLENASKIVKNANVAHQTDLEVPKVRMTIVKKMNPSCVAVISLLSESIASSDISKKVFENMSVKIADEALQAGLTIEETIDGVMFVKKSVTKSLESSGLLLKLDSKTLTAVLNKINYLADIVSSQVAFVFHNSHQKVQEEYFNSEEKFSRVFDLAPVAYTITNLNTGKIINANEMFSRLTGYSLSELVGKSAQSAGIVPDKETEKMIKIRRQMLDKTGYISKYHRRFKTKQGEIKTLLCSSVIVKIKGEPHILTNYLERTEKQALAIEQEYIGLIQAHEELTKLSQAKDQFIGITSHQLRTPATAVKQYVGMILEDMVGEITDQQRKYLETAYRSNERQLKLINDFLKTAQIDTSSYALRKKRQDLQKTLKTAILNATPSLESRRQNIVFLGASEKLMVVFDKPDIDLVFSNLIDNASKYSPEGSTITVSMSKQNNHAVINITDQGVGIDSKDQTKIFDKFTRVRNTFTTPDNGNGLGLHWVKKILNKHAGKIMVTSKLNQGSTFTVWLPL